MRSNVVRQIFGAISWNFIGMLFSLVNGIVTARLLDPDDRGLLALSLSISSLSLLVSSMGTHGAVRTHQPTKSWASFRTYIYTNILLIALNAVVVMLAIWIFVQAGFVEFNNHVLVVAILAAANFTSSMLLDMFNAAGRASTSAMADTLGHFTTMVSLLLVVTLLPTSVGLRGVILCYIFSYIVRVFSMLLLARKAKFDYGTFTMQSGARFMRTSLKFWGIGLSRTLTFRSDQLLLGLFSAAHQVGLYAVAFTPASLMQVFSNSIGQVAYREAAMGRITVRSLKKLVMAGFAVSTTYAIVLWILAPYVMPLVFGHDYASSVPVVRVLVIAGIILSPYNILVRVLAGLNSPHMSTLTGVTGILVLGPTMYLLAPEHGAMGAAMSSTISYASMLAVAVIGVTIKFRQLNSCSDSKDN